MENTEKYIKLLEFVKSIAKQEKYTDEELTYVLNNSTQDMGAYVESFIMLKARILLSSIKE